jgi:hypothetical protein
MPEKNPDNNLIEKIIKAAYGDATIFEKISVYFLNLKNKAAKNLFNEYRSTTTAVQKLKQDEAPSSIVEKAKAITNQKEKSKKLLPYILLTLYERRIPAAAFGLILLATISFLIFREPASIQKYSKAEIELAQKQLDESLAIVAKVFRKAEIKVNEDILTTKVSKQLNKGLTIVSDYVTGG